jgi:branched-subunit amino acid aminotransferase/4-amino-4-deoxychorismate lyase
MFVSVNDNILPEKEALIPAVTDGLFYGAGCFETFTSYSGHFLHLEKHISRLNEGIEFLTGSDDDVCSALEIQKEIGQLLARNNLKNEESIVRIQAFLSGSNGYQRPNRQVQTVITAAKLENFPDPQTLATSEIHVVPASCKPAHLKLSNMLHYRQAGISAKNNGADDALMLTVDGNIAETSIGNLFWEDGQTVYTPSPKCDILPGIMRAVVIKILDKMGIPVREGEYSRQDILDSNQVWFTNSVREIVQVSRIDHQTFKTGTAFMNQLKQELYLYKQGQFR